MFPPGWHHTCCSVLPNIQRAMPELPIWSWGLKKGELASQLGTVNETLSRCFKKLKDEGIIELDGRKVTILHMERLQQLANRQH